MDDNGKTWSSTKDVQRVIVNYSNDVFASHFSGNVNDILQAHASLVQVTKESYIKPCSRWNIDKIPGPYGLNTFFYEDYWPMISVGVLKFPPDVFEQDELDLKINHTHNLMI